MQGADAPGDAGFSASGLEQAMHDLKRLLSAAIFTPIMLLAGLVPAAADAPKPWQMGMQDAASPVAEAVHRLDTLVLVIITAITVFVAALLLWVAFRYSAKRNPVPSRTSHNTLLEVAWTVIPVLILVVIAIPSFRLVYLEDRTREADMTIKVVGHQWYWQYDYSDSAKVEFASRMIAEEDLKPGQKRLLEVDNQLAVPVGKNIRILTTSADVIHSFFIPSLGVQRYAIPGRTIETWFRVDKAGVYYGECNQVCGINHSAMPIGINAMPEGEFQAWLANAKTKFAAAETAPIENAAPIAVAQNLR
jgi:cytochrome c oxidase subunit 2